MIATREYVERKFAEFNRQMFAGQLKPVPVVLSNAKTFLGKLVYTTEYLPNGKVRFCDFHLRINTRLDLPEDVLEDTIIHEMIHYYIASNNYHDSSSHGPLFRRLMNNINAKYGRHVSVSFHGTTEQTAQLRERCRRVCVVAVISFAGGETGMKVLPRVIESIVKYCKGVGQARGVQSIELYMTHDAYFNDFPCSSAFRYHVVDRDTVMSHLTDAVPLDFDGETVQFRDR